MSFKVIFFVLFQTLVAKQCTWTRNSVLSYHYYHTLTYVGDRSFIQCYTWEYRWQYMIACVSVYTVALELVASSSSSQSCFSRLVPCGVLVWFLQRGLHLAIQGSLRRKYHFFFFSASACSEQGLQTGTVVAPSLRVWQGETGWCQDTDHSSWWAQGVYLYLKTKFHFNAIVWEVHEK